MNTLPPPARLRCIVSKTALALLLWARALPAADAQSTGTQSAPRPPASATSLAFINTGFENASPVWYDFTPDGTIQVHLLYDNERFSPNRAAGHIHFQLQAPTGSKLTLEFKNLDNVWNGQPASVANELRTVVVSEDGRAWKPVPLENLPGDCVRLVVEMPGPKLYLARLEPYRLSDLDHLLASIRQNPLVEITPIGKTVEGRELGGEIIRIGNPRAKVRVFLRASEHIPGNPEVIGLWKRLFTDCLRMMTPGPEIP